MQGWYKKERRQDRDGECRELIDGVVSEELESRVLLHHPYIVARCGLRFSCVP